ncbi:MAG: DciA family protein [Candidatus Omnitrophica bacterium]|nr:DciA family protein [Candidatus Omnitrophota bacterium]MDD5592488.1 DciA family protein [Candidatus Omnitrophota bacterium]
MDSVKDIVADLMRGLKNRKPPKDDPELLLKKALSKEELRHTKFRYFRRGILGIAVDSSVRLYNLNLHKSGLLAKLAKKSPVIKDIRFYIGETT